MFRLVLLFWLLSSLALSAQDQPILSLGKVDSLYSEILDEQRPYWVLLPNSYDDTTASPQQYPILILLDARRNFQMASGVIPFMSRNVQIPEMIVIAIPNTNRVRDFTPTNSTTGPEGETYSAFESSGKGDQFLKFLEDELLTTIDSSYRTMPLRVLVGHSLGGLLVCEAYLSHNASFSAYIAVDPSLWWDNQLLVKQAKSDSVYQQPLDSRLYIAAAHKQMTTLDNSSMRLAQEAFFVALEENSNQSLQVKFQHFDQDDHGTIPLPALYHGLQYIFEGLHLSSDKMLTYEPAAIVEHYRAFSEKIGFTFTPSESEMKLYADYFFYRNDEKEKGLAFYQMNVDNYPKSYQAHQYLADALRELGRTDDAIRHYQQSLELHADNEKVKAALGELLGK
ncbi:MAG: alpha/beta hydrolase-fold protein [Bacteroidota bacterium]